MTREDTGDLHSNGVVNLVDPAACVDKADLIGIPGRLLLKSFSNVLKVSDSALLDAVALAYVSRRRHCRIEIKNTRPLRRAVAASQFACLPDCFRRDAPRDALINDRGKLVAIAEHD